ncbi:MAG: hypothetical protein KAI99_11365, partial [Cyclobacteriaceae bacterium]|nr:hypothetical protein [Cyclobacteriaceae bacterium]
IRKFISDIIENIKQFAIQHQNFLRKDDFEIFLIPVSRCQKTAKTGTYYLSLLYPYLPSPR